MTRLVPIGKTGIAVTPVIFGAWQAGGEHWPGVEEGEVLAALRAALDAGVNAVDTAEAYGKGRSERLVGKAVAGRRHEVVIISKVFANHLHADAVARACEQSLKNLGTDYIDLYLIHWPAGSFGMKPVPPQATMAALNQLKAQGKIRAAGICNAGPEQIRAYLDHGTLDAVQMPFSLLWHQAGREILPFCQSLGMAFMAYSPLAQGILAGRFGNPPEFSSGDHRARNRLFDPEIYEKVCRAVTGVSEMAKEMGVTPARLALAWAIAKTGGAAVAGARNPAQARDNARAMEVSLAPEVLARLEGIARPATRLLGPDFIPWHPPER